jgi:hypothetical protein
VLQYFNFKLINFTFCKMFCSFNLIYSKVLVKERIKHVSLEEVTFLAALMVSKAKVSTLQVTGAWQFYDPSCNMVKNDSYNPHC